MTNSHESTGTALDAVVARAALNPQFRTRLLTEPDVALREVLGVPLPPNVTVRFIEKEPGLDAMMVLPDLVPDGGFPLPIDMQDIPPPICWVTCGITMPRMTEAGPDDSY